MKFLLALTIVFCSLATFGQASTGLVQGTQRRYVSAVIPATGTTTPVVDMGGYTLNGIIFPATVVGTSISFTTSDTAAGTFVPVYSTAGTPLTYTAGGSRFIAINPTDIQALRFIKIVSNTAETTGLTMQLALRHTN